MVQVELEESVPPIGMIEHLLPVVVDIDIPAEAAILALIVDECREASPCKSRVMHPSILEHVTLCAVGNRCAKISDSLAYKRPFVVSFLPDLRIQFQAIPPVPVIVGEV